MVATTSNPKLNLAVITNTICHFYTSKDSGSTYTRQSSWARSSARCWVSRSRASVAAEPRRRREGTGSSAPSLKPTAESG